MGLRKGVEGQRDRVTPAGKPGNSGFAFPVDVGPSRTPLAHPVRHDRSREVDALEAGLPEAAAPMPLLPWRGRGNVLTVTGVALLDLVSG
jgi:hypothetical protein